MNYVDIALVMVLFAALVFAGYYILGKYRWFPSGITCKRSATGRSGGVKYDVV
jgi:hypothetical protein